MKNMKTNKINNNAKSYLAKLLATENISVEHKKVKTAYFDVKSRLLVLPIWKDMNEDITDLLIAHEVGHALFTPQSGWEDSIIKRKIPKSFLNVIEDARIEKLIKRKYPGLSQSFIRGYRDLINNNFFGTKDKDLDNMLLIDRLNIHFKSSHVESPITFTDTYENDVVSRMEKLETFEDVINLADELSKYCKEEQEQKEQEMQTNGFDDHDFDDFDNDDFDQDGDNDSDSSDDEEEEKSGSKPDDTEGDDDSKDSEEQESGNQSEKPSSGTQSEQELKGEKSKPVAPPEEVSAETDQSWEDKKENLLDPKSKNNEYINIHNYKNVNDYIVDYKTVLSDFDRVFRKPYKEETKDTSAQNAISKMISKYRQFNKDQSKKVSYMVKEYEMKKAAAAYSRTKQDKSGIIDPLKLHSYKYNDDIFKRMAITPDGKNHGMMMFIDWSGSMQDKMTPTIHQLMNLTMFCQKVNIPFEVYAFSNDSYNKWDRESKYTTPKGKSHPKYEDGDITVDERLSLLNFVSSRMNAKEYEKGMINLFMLSERYDYTYYSRRRMYNMDSEEFNKFQERNDYLNALPHEPSGYGLASTPLNDCIMASMPMVNAFRKRYAIDKMNTIFLTDGSSDGNDRYVTFNPTVDEKELRYMTKQPGGYYISNTHYDNNLVLRDTKTKKEYMTSYRDMTDSLLDALRQRTGTKVLGFYIASGKKLDRYTLEKYFPTYSFDKKQKVFDRKKVMAEYRKNKCLVVKHNSAYDEFYLLAGGNLQVSDGQMATPSENAKKSEIKRLFTSTLKENKDSRVVLNKFISQVA
jgi:flagellin-like hook-associated protein FlgL